MLNPFNPTIDQATATVVDWWHAHPVQGLLAALLLAAVITAAAMALTALENRRASDELAAVQADDLLLDRLGSATAGQPTSDLDALALAWRDEIEAKPFGDLVDTDTAIATIKAGAA